MQILSHKHVGRELRDALRDVPLKHAREIRDTLHRHLPSKRSRSAPVAAKALGAGAVLAMAFAAGAIGALAIGRLAIRKAHVGALRVDDLSVGKLTVDGDAAAAARAEEASGSESPGPENSEDRG
jgi:hypothetical protein